MSPNSVRSLTRSLYLFMIFPVALVFGGCPGDSHSGAGAFASSTSCVIPQNAPPGGFCVEIQDVRSDGTVSPHASWSANGAWFKDVTPRQLSDRFSALTVVPVPAAVLSIFQALGQLLNGQDKPRSTVGRGRPQQDMTYKSASAAY